MRSRWPGGWPVALVVLAGVILTLTVSTSAARDRASARTEAFRSASERVRLLVQARVDERTGVQEVLRDAVVSNWPIDRVGFRRLTVSDTGRDLFKGPEVVSFDRLVPATDRAALEASVRNDRSMDPAGYPAFTVVPSNSPHGDLIVVEYIEPLEGNETVLGFDIGSDPTRRAAVELARDSGELVATAPVKLRQPGSTPGLLLVTAVYDTSEPLVTAPSRRRHFVGVVATVVQIRQLLGADFDRSVRSTVDVEIYDQGVAAQRGAQRFDRRNLVFDGNDTSFVQADGTVDGLANRLDLDVGGRRWSLIARPGPQFSGRDDVGLILTLVGFGLTASIAFSFAALSVARTRAERLVAQRTADLRALVESAPDATVVVDQDGTIVLASDRVTELLGYEPQALIGTPVDDLVPDEVRARHANHRADFALSPSGRMMGDLFTLEARRSDGTTVAVEVSLNPLPEHSIGTVVVSLRDASIQRKAVEDLRTADQMKSTFLSTVTHELKTPLTAIAGFARLLQQGPPLDAATTTQFVDRIVGNTETLENLIDEVLEFSRLERDAAYLDPQPADLLDLTTAAVDQLSGVVTDHAVHVGGETTPAFVDRAALNRIVTNLLTNAIRYSPPGTTVELGVRPDAAASTGVLTVDDSGPGIPPDERDAIFERFWRGTVARQSNVHGTGIGLAVVADLCAKSGGSVVVSTSPTGGARFTVTLPASAPEGEPTLEG